MDNEFDPVETEEEYQERRSELIEGAKESKQDFDAKTNELLNAVGRGEDGLDVEKYETVEVGEVEVVVKAWLPGEAQDTIQHAQRLAQRENMDDAQESIYTMIEGVTTVTERISLPGSDESIESKEDIRQFWRGVYDKWGIVGFQEGAQRALKPATDEMEELSNTVDGFRGDGPRPRPGANVGNDGQNS